MLRLTLLAFVWFAACSEAGDPADTPLDTPPTVTDATGDSASPEVGPKPDGALDATVQDTLAAQDVADVGDTDSAPSGTLELVVTGPASTPSGDTVYVSGSLPVILAGEDALDD